MTIFRHLRPLSTIFWKNPRLIRKGIQIFQPKIKFSPITWNFGKTLATSRVSLKSNKSKSSDEQNETKIVENQEIAEVDVSLILRNPETNRYDCPIEDCTKSFPTRGNLNRHIKHVHLNLRPYKCDFENCSESFHTRQGLETHINGVHLNLRPYKCDYENCSESFHTRQKLERHINGVHKNIRPFECDICGESFTLKENLDRHKATHEEDLKPVECPHCDEKFKNFKELETHIKKSHTMTAHQCSDCKKYYPTRKGLNQHIKYCKKIKEYKCPDPECEKSFVTKLELDDHIARKHSDERNHICDFEGCGEAFKTEADLRQHKKSHSDKRLHKCPYCPNPKAYKTLQSLRTHVSKKHQKEYKEENDPKVEE